MSINMSLNESVLPTSPPKESDPPEDQVRSPPNSTQPKSLDLNDPSLSHLSKNQLKKLRKRQEWEAGREQRKEYRKDKRKEKRIRDKEQKLTKPKTAACKPRKPQLIAPLTVIIDTAFDHLMNDGEVVSLSVQINRSYSCIRKSPLKPILALSSFGGRLKERFDTTGDVTYRNWKGVEFCEQDVIEVGKMAVGWMSEVPDGALEEWPKMSDTDVKPAADEIPEEQPTLVYLSADSPNLLTSLLPKTAYVIGGLVDKNRYKGHCQELAEKAGIATARLPIAEYVQLSARKVLTVNHVVEIMIGWLETGDWEKSFLNVIPQRTGISAKADTATPDNEAADGSSEEASQ